MELKSNRLIVVLGMHRSGTSVIARALQVLGVDLGSRLLPPKGDNQKGFWEDVDLNALNIEMLNAINSDWHHLVMINPMDVENLVQQGFLLRATELLKLKVDDVPLFGFKDPRVAKLLPFWQKVFRYGQFDVSYVMTLRHPLSVARSLTRRNGLDAEKSYYLWIGHVLTGLINSIEHKRVLVDFDRLLQEPEYELTRIANTICLKLNPVALQSYKTEFLDQDLRNTVYNINDLSLDANCPPLAHDMYAVLLEVAKGKLEFEDCALKKRIDQWSDEFERSKSLLGLADKFYLQKVASTQIVVERDGQIASLNQVVQDKDVHINNFRRAQQESDKQIAILQQQLVERDGQIASLNLVMQDKDVHINNFRRAQQESDKQIAIFQQQLVERDGEIAGLERKVTDLASVVEAIFASNSWRVTQSLRTLILSINQGISFVRKTIISQVHFDAVWYLKRNPDVAMNGMDAYEHYVLFGKMEGRRPRPDPFIIRNIKRATIIYCSLIALLKRDGEIWSTIKNTPLIFRSEGMEGIRKRILSLYNQFSEGKDVCQAYKNYIDSMEPTKAELDVMREAQSTFHYQPKFSIVVPVFNVKEVWLRKFIESVRSQVYPNWELCIADDCSANKHIRPLLESYAAMDDRIKVTFREINGHISAATNSAIELATGDFMCLMDNDDEIARNALYEFASLLQREDQVDMIYSDEDKLDMHGNRYEPFFKPDWSPESLEGCMYTAHFACYRMSIVRELGGFRVGYDGAQDYDFVLRFTERAKKIFHVPKVLYHWRAIPGSTAASMEAKDYVLEAALRALRDRANRMSGGGEVKLGRYAGSFDVRYAIQGLPLVSVVIPSAGRSARVRGGSIDLLVNVVRSIYEKNTYRNFEVIVVDNGDLRQETIDALTTYSCRFVHFDGDFNIATKMNMGAKEARGDYLLFMNDDIEVIADDWMECMLQLAQRSGVGAVGAKLHFENGKTQHVGVAFWNGLPDHVRREFPETDPGHFFSSCANRNYLAVTGAVLMTKRRTFERVNGFDERFAINYNDIDYCLKVFEGGERIVFASGADLYHFESISRERTVDQDEIDLFRDKWGTLVSRDPYYSSNFESHPPNFLLRNDWNGSAN